jgi:hypothetical protein
MACANGLGLERFAHQGAKQGEGNCNSHEGAKGTRTKVPQIRVTPRYITLAPLKTARIKNEN